MRVLFKSEIGARVARSQMEKPSEWSILPERSGFRLVRV